MILIGRYPSIKVKSEYSCFIKFDYDKALVNKVKSLPIRYYIPEEKVWEVPLDSINRVAHTFGIENIKPFTEFPEYEEYVAYHNKHVLGRKTPQELKEYYKNVKMDVEFKTKTTPKGHQIESFNLALKKDSILITDLMGLGKTAQSLYIADYKKSIDQVSHVLIICGINSLKYNWVNEIEIHSWNNCQVIDGTRKKKLEKIRNIDKYYYNIINVEMLRDDEITEIFEKLIDDNVIGMIIADEIHKLSNALSKQGSNFQRLHSKYKIGLTGTPITKKVEKLWSILYWMGIITEKYWKFRERYCILGGFTGHDIIGYKNMDELHEILDQYQLRRTKDILELPPKVYQTVYVDMTKDQLSEYGEIRRGIIRDIESGDVKHIDPFAATIKLRQYTDIVKQAKLKELVSELVDDNEKSVVIFSQYRNGLDLLKEDTLKEYNPYLINGSVPTEQRQEIIDNFQSNPNPEVVMGTIATLGTGYTLTKSNFVIFLNKDWTVGNNAQAEDRCHRIGSKDTVTVISLIVKDSIDERVEEILEHDQFYIDQVVDGKIEFKHTQDVLTKLLDL